MNNWIGWSTVEEYLRDNNVFFSFDEHGVQCQNVSITTHLDIYSMKYSNDNHSWFVDWDSSPECKIEDVKDVFAVLFGKENDWEEKFEEMTE